jgi:hypothetical protein
MSSASGSIIWARCSSNSPNLFHFCARSEFWANNYTFPSRLPRMMITIKGRADADMTRSGKRSSRLALGLGMDSIPYPRLASHAVSPASRFHGEIQRCAAYESHFRAVCPETSIALSGERGLDEHHLGRVSLKRGAVLHPWRVAEPSLESIQCTMPMAIDGSENATLYNRMTIQYSSSRRRE